MKPLLFFSILLGVFANTSFAQLNNSKGIQFIKDYPIKIDGGCSFYTYDTTSLSLNKYIFIISAKQLGFIDVGNHYVYLKNTKNVKSNNNEYKKTFNGEGYNIILDVKKVGNFDSSNSLCEGFMEIKNKNFFQHLKIHGKIANR